MGFRPKARVARSRFESSWLSGNRTQNIVKSVLVAGAGGTRSRGCETGVTADRRRERAVLGCS